MADIPVNAPNLQRFAVTNPTIADGSNLPENTEKKGLSEKIIQTQNKLTEIEKDFGDGGNYILNVVRNHHAVVGAATNNNPQGYVIPQGKRVVAGVAVTPKGTSTLDGGIPVVNEVDNWSAFPCGNYNIEAGNRFSVKSGGGGVHLVSSGGASLISETVTKIGSTTETLIGGENVVINGNTNVTVKGDLVNLQSDTQVVVDSTLGVTGNVIVQGGIYSEGELFVNHITGPREISETVIGFSGEGAEGQLVFGNWIAGTALLGGTAASWLGSTAYNLELEKILAKDPYPTQLSKGGNPKDPAPAQWPFFPDYTQTYTPLGVPWAITTFAPEEGGFYPIYTTPGIQPFAATTKVVPVKIFLGTQGNNAVELLPHGHQVVGIPMTLLESTKTNSVNNVMRERAVNSGINQTYPVPSTPISDAPKYNKPGFVTAIFNKLISMFINFPGNSKSYNVS